MSIEKIGFIGGGRVTRILLTGWARSRPLPRSCVVSDVDREVLERLHTSFPFITPALSDNALAMSQDLVFGALHPPAMTEELPRLRRHLRGDVLFVSLAPKLTRREISEALGGFDRIVRMIPNAASVVAAGFNPVSCAQGIPVTQRLELLEWLSRLGECPEVEEETLEAYAILTGMGPTYLWFQLAELAELGVAFGLRPETTYHALRAMTAGAAQALFASDLPPEEVMDLVPVKPLGAQEKAWRETYRSTLTALYEKIHPRPEPILA